jgi:hypothetical protein
MAQNKQTPCSLCGIPAYGTHCRACSFKVRPQATRWIHDAMFPSAKAKAMPSSSWWVGPHAATHESFAPVAAQEFDQRLRFVPGSSIINIID